MQPVHFTNYQLRVLLQGSSSEPRRSQTVNDCRLVSGIVRLVSGIVSVVYICIIMGAGVWPGLHTVIYMGRGPTGWSGAGTCICMVGWAAHASWGWGLHGVL